MCTVTLIRNCSKKNDFILTSNRDEAAGRSTLYPQIYSEENVKLMYPKDAEAGGTWIGVSDKNRIICLLNGEFKIHKRQQNYRLSRGVVVKDFLKAQDLEEIIKNYDFENIEPFTIIAGDWNADLKFTELVWDGKTKHIREITKSREIWSSSPLYSEAVKIDRLSWFQEFESKNELDPKSLWKFHHTAGKGDINTNLIMDRGFVKTKSITQVVKTSENIKMIYEDLEENKIIQLDFN